MQRLFTAIELPHVLKQRLMGVTGGIEGARWQTVNQLHLSLRFIGDVEPSLAMDIQKALEQIGFSPFSLKIGPPGLFGKLRSPRILYAGIDRSEPLRQLNAKIERCLVSLGCEAETRRYTPHITLARFRKGARGRLDDFFASNGAFSCAPFEVAHFTLFRSHLSHNGAHYEALAHYPATGS